MPGLPVPVKLTLPRHFKGKKSHFELVYPQLHENFKDKSARSHRHLILVLRTSEETFYIELEANEDILNPNESNAEKKSGKHCHYKGTVLSHSDGMAAISMCESRNKMIGTIMVDNSTFLLRPLDHLQYEEEIKTLLKNITYHEDIEPHVINKFEDHLTNFCGLNHKGINIQDDNDVSMHRRFRRSNEESKYKVIETAVFVDHELYRKFTVVKKWSEQELIDAVMAMMNQVQVIFNYSPLSIKFKIPVVKLEILTEENGPNTENGRIDKYLENFCEWQSLKNPPENEEGHWDHSVMLSGYDLFTLSGGEKDRKILGHAWIRGMCRPKHSCTVNEGSNFESAFVIAHELGHSLGMQHDGVGNDCDSEHNLMSDRTGFKNATWSRCSNEYLVRFFQKGEGACLKDDNNILVDSSEFKPKELPGHRFDLDQQCKLSLGQKYKPFFGPKVPFNNVCQKLWCASRFWATSVHPALEGSSCGNGGHCIQGKCEGEQQTEKSVSEKMEEVLNAFKTIVFRYISL